ncbi:hypothetical protein IX39_12690 [Chryseobacterium formosense]|uniref:GLPGLI family protein n=1 Tax=Chryseobacterium formosense TaxID=236814 RepID=A0A085ZAF2_9FLAO|nr:GLPGLI family protein [Chryseobacterium formosense]KFF01416.1 hypothetical protein IX39_12690 [Chryseobacterium formosense]SFT47023.1 GLPGLI family protein [Chryseobacterium formosense]
MKISKKSFLLFIFLYTLSFSQSIQVTYAYKPSNYFEFEENVFLVNGQKVSIVDSIPLKKIKPNSGEDIIIERDNGIKRFRTILIDDLKNHNTLFTFQIKKNNFLISDTVPEIKWDIKHKETKRIGKYNCKKATANFRGTVVEAYYTTEIPVSIGPYKFSGLPGLILELKTGGTDNYSWIVKNIQYPYTGVVDYSTKYIAALPKKTMKNLVAEIDKRNSEEQSIFLSKLQLPPGIGQPEVETVSGNTRGLLENKFEWE